MIYADITRRFEILRSLFEMSRGQRDALAADDLGHFNELLDRREALLGELAEVQPPADVQLLTSEPSNVIPFPGTVRPGSEPIESDDEIALQGLLRAVLHIDEENEQTLQRRLAEIRLALQETGRAKVTARSYRPVAAAMASAVDRSA